MAIQNSALTINQEKQIRQLRLEKTIPWQRAHNKLQTYERLAKAVALYRRSQKLVGGSTATTELRKEFLEEIDTCLELLGLK